MKRVFVIGLADIEGPYRYALWRNWNPAPKLLPDQGRVCWVMLNPSTADDREDDPTIRRCIGFSRAWGYGCLSVVNLFALRSTDPQLLRAAEAPIGPGNDAAIVREARGADLVVAAWGTWGGYRERDREVVDLLRAACIRLHALEVTRDGHPRHPLYLPRDARPSLWDGRPHCWEAR